MGTQIRKQLTSMLSLSINKNYLTLVSQLLGKMVCQELSSSIANGPKEDR
jgi:hypothetical protein